MIEEKPSEPPHCRPTVMWLAGTGARVTRLASGSISWTAAMPASMVLRVPPASCMTKVRSRAPPASFSLSNSVLIWLRSQPRPITSTAAKFGVADIAGQRAPQQIHRLARHFHAAAERRA